MLRTITHFLVLGTVWAFLLGCSASKSAKQDRFGSPDEAAKRLIQALEDDEIDALVEVFGPGSESLLSSGDPIADKSGRKFFLSLASESYRIDRTDDQVATLLLGANEWPFPIPLVQSSEGWVFDTVAGKEEIIDRRIGRNEIETLTTLIAIVDAQKEYKERKPNGVAEYARHFGSSPHMRDGLFWARKRGELPSPLGPLVVEAVEAGYATRAQAAQAFHGYRFKMLFEQGSSAKGGKKSYFDADKRLSRGFAVLAYPAEWGSSGIMSFMTSADGVIYERDLGRETTTIASAISAFDPGAGWKKVDIEKLAEAGE